MSDCVLCQLLAGELPVTFVYRDEECAALMDIQPVNHGHVLVIPTKHVPYLADLDSETAGHLMQHAQRIAAAIRKTDVQCEGIDLFLADGEAAGQEVFHVHLHVFPRYKNDGFGFKFRPGYTDRPPRAELDRIGAQIVDALNGTLG